jgi:hypothetical protein
MPNKRESDTRQADHTNHMQDWNLFFDGLFRSDGRDATRDFSGCRWDFPAADLNESAKALFRHIDDLREILEVPDHTFLTSVELDAEPGRFPEVLLQYFRDDAWDDTKAFFVAPIQHATGERGCPVGRLTFESEPGQLARILRQNGGLRWGSALRVWGMQVVTERLPKVIGLSPYDGEQLDVLQGVSRTAWLAAHNLNGLALWCVPSLSADVKRQLSRMDGTA